MIPLKDLTEKAVWARLDEERLASEDLVVELQNRFGSKTNLKLENTQDQGKGKKIKELKFLDQKSAQNLSVVQGIGTYLTYIWLTFIPPCDFRRKFEAHQLLCLQVVHPSVWYLSPDRESSADTHSGGHSLVILQYCSQEIFHSVSSPSRGVG